MVLDSRERPMLGLPSSEGRRVLWARDRTAPRNDSGRTAYRTPEKRTSGREEVLAVDDPVVSAAVSPFPLPVMTAIQLRRLDALVNASSDRQQRSCRV